MVRALILSSLLVMAMAPAMAGDGDALKGADVFKRCAMCHSADKNAGNRLGPNLAGIVGRKAASLPGFNYSDKLKSANIVWTEDNLQQWVMGPQKMVPGTRMTFAGLSNAKDAADLVAFLKTRTDTVVYAKAKN